MAVYHCYCAGPGRRGDLGAKGGGVKGKEAKRGERKVREEAVGMCVMARCCGEGTSRG